jgi:hypothetical protein
MACWISSPPVRGAAAIAGALAGAVVGAFVGALAGWHVTEVIRGG